MGLERDYEFDLNRILRSDFSDNSPNDSLYSYEYYYSEYSDYCSQSTGKEWAFILSLMSVFLGVFTTAVYLIVSIRPYHEYSSNFHFLNNFVLASLINLLWNGLGDVMALRSYCWHGGRLLCKALPTILDVSENAMILFIVAMVLEQNNPKINSVLAKNIKPRKRKVVAIVWFVTILLAIPEVFLWDVLIYYDNVSLCGMRHRHVFAFFSKAIFVEYLLPLVFLLVMLSHAAIVRSKRSRSRSAHPTPDDTHSESKENEPPGDNMNQGPQIRVTSISIGVMFFVAKTPNYVSYFLFTFFHLYLNFLSGFSHVLYPVPSIVAPVLVLFSSPIHKKRLKETYQYIASYVAGRYVKERFLLSEDNETNSDDLNLH